MKYTLRFFLLFFIFTSQAFTQTIRNEDISIKINKIFIGDNDSLNLSNIESHLEDFSITPSEEVEIPQTYWMELIVENRSDETNFLINFDNWQYVEVLDNRNNTINITGTLVPVKERVFPFYNSIYVPIQLKKGTVQLFCKVQSSYTSLQPPKSLTPLIVLEKDVQEKRNKTNISIAIYIGCIFIMFFYNLFLYFSLKVEYLPEYLGYIFMAFYATCKNFGIYEYYLDNSFFTSITTYVDLVGSFIYAYFIISFTLKFLNVKSFSPIFYKILNLYKILVFLTVPLGIYFSVYAMLISHLLGLSLFVIIIFTAINAIRHKIISSKLFLIGFSFFIVGLSYFLLTEIFNLSNDSFFAKNSLQIGHTLEFLIFSIAIGHRFYLIKKENLLKQEIIIDQLKTNQDLNNKINNGLELLVANRTLELRLEKESLNYANQQLRESINYAKRLQNAILTPEKELLQNFKSHTIYYKPKDIVSGDFYWVNQNNKYTFWAICDCTGHGVPGAIMSMIGYSTLNDIILKRNMLQPHEILNELSKEIDTTLNHSVEGEGIHDGMDIAICRFDHETNILHYSGAFISTWVLRDSKIIELKADRHPIGKSYFRKEKYNSTSLKLLDGDKIFAFTDGFTDQFGGTNEKKFGKKRLRELITFFANETLHKQTEIITSEIERWKGKTEQTDDMLFMGVEFNYKTNLKQVYKYVDHV